MPDKFSGPSLGSDNHSHSLLIIDTMKKLEKWKEKLEDEKDKKKVLSDNIRLLKAKNESLRAERSGLKQNWKKNCVQFPTNKK